MAAVRLRATSVSPSYLVGLRDLRDAVRADPLAAARVDGDHLTADGRADGVALERRVGGLELRPRDVDLELRLVADRGGSHPLAYERVDAGELALGVRELDLGARGARVVLGFRVEHGDRLPGLDAIALLDEELRDHHRGSRRAGDADDPVLRLEAAEGGDERGLGLAGRRLDVLRPVDGRARRSARAG